MKKYIIISGFNIRDNNRGTAALGYGSISFLQEKGYLTDDVEFVNFWYVRNLLKKDHWNKRQKIKIGDKIYTHTLIYVSRYEKNLFDKCGILLPWTDFGRAVRHTLLVANINGGDGFSDIYSTPTFLSRLDDTYIAQKKRIKYIILPQTLGPFSNPDNLDVAKDILIKAEKIYVRDDKFIPELTKMGLEFELTKDLSAYMLPEPWNINIKEGSIGLNVSGLAYSNSFRSLSGQFDSYPELIDRIICYFQEKGKTVYLIPHSYNYQQAEKNNDDMVACKAAYEKLKNKSNVVLVDRDLISPQVKYLISQMSFFIGTRMHANFAAIYTGVPLFGLAYSYKFAGAFNANGLNGEKQTAMINNIGIKDIDTIINKINNFYNHILNK